VVIELGAGRKNRPTRSAPLWKKPGILDWLRWPNWSPRGCRAPGTVYEQCSPEFKKILEQADLIISKGQGNFECLEQLRGPFFFLLKAKCRVVSRYLGSLREV